MYAVKRVEGIVGGKPVSFGTGWALCLPLDNPDFNLNMIVTNFHVVNGMDEVRVLFHTTTNGELDGDSVYLSVAREHIVTEQPGPDIALILFGASLNQWINENPGRSVFWTPLDERVVVNEEAEKTLDACEPILMVGCPSGLWDEANGFPLFRRGVTASHPAVNFMGRPEFVVDIGVYSGSSGSPVMLWEQGLIKTNKGGQEYSPGQRFWLLGMLWGGPRIAEGGQLVAEPIPSDTRISIATSVRMHLGYVVKIREIMKLAHKLRDQVNNEAASTKNSGGACEK